MTSAFLAVVFLAWMVRAVAVVFFLREPWTGPLNADTSCRTVSVSCGAITGWVTSLLSIALASTLFLIWRFKRLDWWYRRLARRDPRELVPTAGPIFGRIVGRDDLCRVVMEDLRDRTSRRPHVLVGGVGIGKTAVLLRLTELLAGHGAVPVPIGLRDANQIDFPELARKRFMKTVSGRVASEPEAEKIWRRLLRDGRIVVLADGLEEALPGKPEQERDTKIRIAIQEAHKERLPLLIASRPHAPLRGMDATIHELEPLSEDAALAYVEESGPDDEERRLSWILHTAQVAAAPLYLQITKEIYDHDMLDQIASRQAEVLGTRSQDPSMLRLRLLQTREEALICGDLYPEVPLTPQERRVTLEWMSALACVGLSDDSIQVDLDARPEQIIKMRYPEAPRPRDPDRDARNDLQPREIDVRLAAAWGAQLGLVEPLAGQVRFQHSLVEAYLGSRLMETVLSDQGYVQEALTGRLTGPAREFLIALVLYSRRRFIEHSRRERERGAEQPVVPPNLPNPPKPPNLPNLLKRPKPAGPPAPPPLSTRSPGCRETVVGQLLRAARDQGGNKALDIYAAALEIASLAPSDTGAAPTHIDVAREVLERWPDIRSGDQHTLEEAKLGLVGRFGQALRTLAGQGHKCADGMGYAELFQICRKEQSYRIRLAAAQEIGSGGTRAFRDLKKLPLIPAVGDDLVKAAESRGRQMSAWLAPLLVVSIDAEADRDARSQCFEQAKDNLRIWRESVRPVEVIGSPEQRRRQLTISEEIALAQGFKYAANHRYGHVHSRPVALGFLKDEALEMLKNARYWFSQLTLIQALCLWQIQESQTAVPVEDPDLDAIVNHWLEEIGGGRGRRRADEHGIHPFVQAAARLAAKALESRRPEQYLWQDECDVVARVGADGDRATAHRVRHDQWILPSMGWSVLAAPAQQLVADVLLLLNLAERGEESNKIEHWLERAHRDVLPRCIEKDRQPLKPGCTVGTAERNPAGSSCPGECQFDLCPYPPKGLQHHRAELSEAFCRRQAVLVREMRLRRRTARWQGLTPKQLRTFWDEMADRARMGPAGN